MQLHRRLVENVPAAFAPRLARVLHHYALLLKGRGRWHEALNYLRESADIYRDLAQEYPLRYRHEVKMTLLLLGDCLESAEDGAGARKAREEAGLITADS